LPAACCLEGGHSARGGRHLEGQQSDRIALHRAIANQVARLVEAAMSQTWGWGWSDRGHAVGERG
jgi:hypothetical protein